MRQRIAAMPIATGESVAIADHEAWTLFDHGDIASHPEAEDGVEEE
jgi:hypothetical protein